MNLTDYQNWAAQTSSLRARTFETGEDTRIDVGKILPALPDGVVFVRVDHAAAGIASEAGEIGEHVKHVRFHGKTLDKDHLVKECGDLLWYLAEMATGLGTTLDEIAERNVEKLRARYPEGHFSIERSERRDLAREDQRDPSFSALERRLIVAAIESMYLGEKPLRDILLGAVDLRERGMTDADLAILVGKLQA